MTKKKHEKLTSQQVYSHIQYQELLTNHNNWLEKANELVSAADKLKAHIEHSWEVIKQDFKEGRYTNGGEQPHSLSPNVQGVYFMLIALAIENMCKAVYVWENRDKLSTLNLFSIGSLPSKVKTHKLKELVDEIGFRVNINDEDLLTRLSINAIWAGRYPVPTDSNKLKNVEIFSEGKPYLTAVFYPHIAISLSFLHYLQLKYAI